MKLIGWSMWFLEFVSLRRNWAKDEATLKAAYNRLRDYPRPFWMVLFVEGTRFTEAKLLAAQEYARANGLQVPKHVLIPKTKGFVSAVQHMRTFVPALYDFTVAVPKTSESPTMSSLLNGKSAEVHLHIRRYNLNDLPKEDGEIANFCRELFMEKDKLLDDYFRVGSFDESLYRPSRRTQSSLWITMGWMLLMALWFLAMGIWALMTGALTGKTIGIVIAIPVLLGLLLKAMMLSTRADLSSSNRRAKRQQQVIAQQEMAELRNVGEGAENHAHAE
ncbi:hypothetical protein CBR_g40183 [Chara braunii]|uniref:1-acylglycerol-3-phosphate O-acyltransferase n=1 Tax=Chara braunii TaxID=69332 RepID=A0A388LTF9_CHABU|nr:hypothetical protein CBR_g40183 [Chara braunii]|eukprot:GBG85545.1 hypothetical protein CBR_g40183 [Chara braunii]